MRRIGLIVPSSNVVVEDVLRRHAGRIPDQVAVHVARLPVVSVSLESGSTAQFSDEPVDSAMDRLLDAGVGEIVFAGTAGGWLGIDRERAWRDRAVERTGVPVDSTTLMTVKPLRAAPAQIAMITPFSDAIHRKIVGNFGSEGISIDHGAFLGVEQSHDMAAVSSLDIAAKIRLMLDRGCGTVLCFCTNFRGYEPSLALSGKGNSARLIDSVGLTLETAGILV